MAVINEKIITKADILDEKRQRQKRILENKLQIKDPVLKPCFVWVFHNDGFPYGGWWLYIRTLKRDWGIGFRRQYESLIPKIMSMWPCGLLPMVENFPVWMVTFANLYHYPTQKRLRNQGMVQAWAKIDCYGDLLDVAKDKTDIGNGDGTKGE